MSSAIERFRERKQIQASASKLRLVSTSPSKPKRIEEPVDEEFVNAPAYGDHLKLNSKVTEDDVQKLLADLSKQFEAQKFDTMVGGLKTSVLQNIAGPFGLGKFISAYDKTGGNVDTVHNVRKGIYGTDKEKKRYEERGEYDDRPYHSHDDYIAANRAMKEKFENGSLVDEYTGEKFSKSTQNDSQLKRSLDHVVSAREVHEDAGRVLAGLDEPKLANKAENFAATAKTINSSKKASKPEDFLLKLQSEAKARKAEIAALEKKGEALTDHEKGHLTKLRKQDKVKAKLLEAKTAEARAAIDSEINRTYYTSAKFAGSAAKSGGKEGAKAGIQQAFGEILVEFFAAVFDELNDLYRNGKSEQTILREIGARFKKIKKRVLGKWKNVLVAFKDGFISGLLSSLLTTLINAFVTTGQRLVRMIRQGFMSLLSAIKMLLFPPKGMTRRQAMHESSKLVVSAGIVVGGIALEEVVSKQLAAVPGINLIGEAVTGALVGSATALVTAFACYLLDRADFFNVNRDAREKAIGTMLDSSRTSRLAEIEKARTALLACEI